MGNEQIDGVLEEELQLLKYTGFSTGLYTSHWNLPNKIFPRDTCTNKNIEVQSLSKINLFTP